MKALRVLLWLNNTLGYAASMVGLGLLLVYGYTAVSPYPMVAELHPVIRMYWHEIFSLAISAVYPAAVITRLLIKLD